MVHVNAGVRAATNIRDAVRTSNGMSSPGSGRALFNSPAVITTVSCFMSCIYCRALCYTYDEGNPLSAPLTLCVKTSPTHGNIEVCVSSESSENMSLFVARPEHSKRP